MPKLKSPSKTYPKMFPAGYSGSQVLRSALKDGPEQRMYTSGDSGLGDHKNLGTAITGFTVYSSQGSLYSSIAAHSPANLSAAVSAVRCQALSAKKYFVGYEDGQPKYIEGRQEFRCVDFLPSYIKSVKSSTDDLSAAIKTSFSSYEDLNSYIIAGKEIFSESRDLNAVLTGGSNFIGSLSSEIEAVRCQALTPNKYFVGYESGLPKFIDGRPRYRCVDFLSASIQQVYYEDLPASIYAIPREHRDLPAYLKAILKQEDYNLRGVIRGWVTDQYDLPAQIKGLVSKDLTAFLRALTHKDLPASIYVIPPKDLPAYLKVWPMRQLPASLHGWQEADLGAFIDWNDMKQLPAFIGAHQPRNLGSLIKGWVREATLDLGGIIRALQYEGLGGIIRGTYLEDLPAYLFCVEPDNLQGIIHGWQEADLLASLIGKYGPHDLQAYINIVGEPRDLPAYIRSAKATNVISDLTAYVNPATVLMQQVDLASIIAGHAPSDLAATLTPSGASNDLSAFVLPKMVYMTTALSVSTMEHLNLGAIVNFVCRGSGYKELGALVDVSYAQNLAASLVGKKYPTYQQNLGSTVGYAPNYTFTDRIPVSLTVGTGYQIEDKIPIILNVYKQQAYLSAAITGTYQYNDMGATITPAWLEEYQFDNIKTRQLVYDINHARQINWYEVVELYFKSIVPEYFYVAGEGTVYKNDRTDRWILEISSFVPEDVELNIRRKLHRFKTVYDLTKFSSLDEAIRLAIHYVTSYDYGDMGAYISPVYIPSPYSSVLPTIIKSWYQNEKSFLGATISPQPKTFVLGYDNKAEFI